MRYLQYYNKNKKQKEGIIINKTNLALEVINLKIAKEMKENKGKKYEEFRKKIIDLKCEREEIYKNNEQIIEKVLDKYLKEIKGENYTC